MKTRRESRSIYYSIADARVQVMLDALHEALCGDPQLREGSVQESDGTARHGESARFAQIIR